MLQREEVAVIRSHIRALEADEAALQFQRGIESGVEREAALLQLAVTGAIPVSADRSIE